MPRENRCQERINAREQSREEESPAFERIDA